jgi:tetratricopeptide (TPR) repeat protein
MQLSLEDARERWVLLAVSSIISAVLIFQASEVWIADRRVQSGKLPSMERGAELLPGNGESWDRVGRFWQLDFANPDLSKAASAYEKAVRDDPASSYYWMDLASAYEDAGDLKRAREAFERAGDVYPLSALVAWNYGNFLVRRHDYSEGYKKIQKAVAADRSLLPLAISRTWRSSEDVNVVLNDALPATPEAYLKALAYFTSIQKIEEALVVWKRLVALGKPLALPAAFPLLDTLIGLDRSDEALRVWNEALTSAGLPGEATAGRSSIRNGDFSRDLANGGLDWRWKAPPGAAAAFDSAPPSQTGRSLRVDFNGGVNVDLGEPAEYVLVHPGRKYHFHAYLRTDGITTDQGVQFQLIDPNHANAVNGLTEDFTGTHPWTGVDADVTSGAQTHFILVRLIRTQSNMFDSKVSGTAWIAGVSLTPAEQPGHDTP